MNQKNLTNQRFGKLVAIKKYSKSKNGNIWLCICDCGKFTTVLSSNLLKNHTKSCGCNRINALVKLNTKHGQTKTRLYGTWTNIKSRCNNPNRDMYYVYGGKGISVCNEWNDFVKFKDWALKNGYKDDLTIDRVNNDGNYEPNNCRWVTITEQSRNRTITIKIKHSLEEKTLIEWCEQFKINYHKAYRRYRKGWSFEKIFEIKNKEGGN